MSVCPNGHSSEASDYCDVCGTPMASAAPTVAQAKLPAPDATTSSAASDPITCPNCSFANLPDALFCENCGYDFTTGSLPEPSLDPSLDLGGSVSAGQAAPSSQAPDAPHAPAAPDTSAAQPAAAAEAVVPAIEGADAWVAEVWVDPEWYVAQKSDDPLPSGGLPDIVVLRQKSLLVGRTSVSRDIHPQIECGSDSGVSRRQCQLTTDGQRWWVEDLQSSNGTYVGAAGAELPTAPIPPGQRRELADGDRIFLGAWTRLVVRKALPGEA